MRPLHLTAAAAVLLVAALVAFMAMPPGGRAGARRGTAAGGAPDAGSDAGPGAPGGSDASGAAPASSAADVARDETDAGPVSITLKIVGPDDAPASGADVVLDRGVDALRVKADEMGVLRLTDFAPGVYDLRARHGDLGGALRFEAKGALDLGTLRLTATVSVTGHVYGPQGEPIPNALVEGRRVVERETLRVRGSTFRVPQPEAVVANAATGADGAYELVLPTGEAYALRATARGLAAANREPAVFATDASGIDFHLAVGAPIDGRIVDAMQVPVAGARVSLCDGWTGLDVGPSQAETLSGADGSFSIVAGPGTRRVLAVNAAGHVRHRQPVTAPATGILVVLRTGVSLRLQAVEGAGAPAAHVGAAVTYIGGSAAGETDARGHLLLENLALEAGAVRGQVLFLWGRGYTPLEIDLGRAHAVDGVVDLGVVKLARGGVVRGKVFDRTTGAPIGGARVGALSGPGAAALGTSAQDGSFRIEGVPLDAHTLTAMHEDFVDEAVPPSGGGSGGPRLFLGGSREAARDVELVPAASVTGVVLAPDGSPAPDAGVTLADDSGRIALLLGGKPPAARTDGKGGFVMKPFRRGQRVAIQAEHGDYGKSEGVVVIAGTAESATLLLTEPVIVQGTVTDPAGAPIAEVRVEAAGRMATTDASGRYVLRLPGPVQRLGFEHPAYQALTLKANVDRSMDLGRTVLAHGATIAGVVVRGDGTPAPSVVVHAAREPLGAAAGRTGSSAVSDAKGAFEIRGIAEGLYRLRTRERDAWSAEVTAKTGARDARIVLLRAGKLLGRVTARGAAVSDARVRAEQPGGAFVGWARSAADGTFEILSVPPDAPFDVVVEHDRFATLRVERVRASDRQQDFALETGVEVSGHVVDGRGMPVGGAEVEFRVDGREAPRTRTDASGAFEAHGLAEGRISVRLAASDRDLVPTGWLDVAPGSRDVRLVAARGASISGVVRLSAGRPAKQVSVQAIDGEGRIAASAWVWQGDGTFDLRGLQAGTYTVRAEQYAADAHPRPSGTVAGVAAGTADLEIRLDP